jgi:hypothetical protein
MKQLKFCAFVAVVFLSTCQIASAQDDKAAKKAAALKRKMKLESCCLLISATNTNSKDFEKTVNEHPEKNKKVIM